MKLSADAKMSGIIDFSNEYMKRYEKVDSGPECLVYSYSEREEGC